MSYRLQIQSEALREVQLAFEWYEEQRDGLGYELLYEIEVCYKKISNHPDRYSYFNQHYRRIKTDRFPYILIFEIDEGRITVNSVRHVKRDKQR